VFVVSAITADANRKIENPIRTDANHFVILLVLVLVLEPIFISEDENENEED
jgi:hypothetical protein